MGLRSESGVPDGQAEIIALRDNFHGRPSYHRLQHRPRPHVRFRPFAPGFRIIPFGNAKALEQGR